MTKPPWSENDAFVAYMTHIGRNLLSDMITQPLCSEIFSAHMAHLGRNSLLDMFSLLLTRHCAESLSKRSYREVRVYISNRISNLPLTRTVLFKSYWVVYISWVQCEKKNAACKFENMPFIKSQSEGRMLNIRLAGVGGVTMSLKLLFFKVVQDSFHQYCFCRTIH